ncbi:MAG: hypothetical protein LBD45_09550 [Bacteroidales bacterium]|jgi:hypothetical protein|nr:hypothetical protein [Bacteroidales bacterium]
MKKQPLLSLICALTVGGLISSCEDPKARLDKKINELESITATDAASLDSLFYAYAPDEYPIVRYENCNERDYVKDVVAKKITYIRSECGKTFEKDYYRETISWCETCNQVQVQGVNIILETSGSMKGYMQCPVFAAVTSLLVPDEYGGTGKADCYLYDEKLKKQVSYTAFSAKLAGRNNQRIEIGRSSQLDKIIENVLDLTAEDAVSFFVTDAIISDENIKGKTIAEISRRNNDLLEKVKQVFIREKKQRSDFSVSIYRFLGEFSGDYFTYNDGKVPLSKIKRPFFVFVLGSSKIVKDFMEKVHAGNVIPAFSHPVTNEVHFIASGKPAFRFKDVSEGDDTLQVRISLNDFPEYVKNREYIKTYANVLIESEKQDLVNVQNTFFDIHLSREKTQDGDNITVSLDMTGLPAWCSSLSNNNDSAIASDPINATQTCYLRELINAIRAGLVTNATEKTTTKLNIEN